MLLGNHHMEHDGFSDKSEREAHDDWDAAANENGGRLTEESDMDQSDELSPGPQATAYVEQSTEEMGEVGRRVYSYSSVIYGALFATGLTSLAARIISCSIRASKIVLILSPE